MKNRIGAQLFHLLFLAILSVIIVSLSKCKNVGPLELPEPTPKITNQIKLAVFDSEEGSPLVTYSINIEYPDGSIEEFNNQHGTLKIDEVAEGTYKISAYSTGYISDYEIINVVTDEIEDVSATIIQQDFYLNKQGDTFMVFPEGSVLTLPNNLEQKTTLEIPSGAFLAPQELVISFLQPPKKNSTLKILGERMIIKGYDFSPEFTFPENAKPVIHIPIDVQSVKDGTPIFLGAFNEETNTWEMVEGTLNESRDLATFVMPRMAMLRVFTGYRLKIKGHTYTPWTLVKESACSRGVCGTYNFVVVPTDLIQNMLELGVKLKMSITDTRCVGPHKDYKQVLYARCQLTIYEVYDHMGHKLGVIQIPVEKSIKWQIKEVWCHDQGGGK